MADRFTSHGLDHIRAGDEHVRGATDHEDEIGQRRRVGRATRARPQDDADLRNHAGGAHVTAEDDAVTGQGGNALLDPRPAAVVEGYEGSARGVSQVHDFVDLLGMHLAQGATEGTEILRICEHPNAVDGAGSGHDPVAERLPRTLVIGRIGRRKMSSSAKEPSSSRCSSRSLAGD